MKPHCEAEAFPLTAISPLLLLPLEPSYPKDARRSWELRTLISQSKGELAGDASDRLFLNFGSCFRTLCLRHRSQAKSSGSRSAFDPQAGGEALRRDEAAQHHRPSVSHAEVVRQRHARWTQESDLQVAEGQQNRYNGQLASL